MNTGKKISVVAIVLLVVLILSIIAVSTVLVGRALGWWDYSDLPVVGSFFPKPPTEPAEPSDPADDAASQLANLQIEVDAKQRRIAELETELRQKDTQLFTATQKIVELEQSLLDATAKKNDDQLRGTANMLQNMKPEQAAAILTHYSDADVWKVLLLMPAETSGAILARFEPARAAKISAAKP